MVRNIQGVRLKVKRLEYGDAKTPPEGNGEVKEGNSEVSGGGDGLDPEKKLNVFEILKDLDRYRPRRKGWHWRDPFPPEDHPPGPFEYRQVSRGLRRSIPLPAARYFEDIDPQPEVVITSEIASGRFEDDLRRFRMAAWHGADHIMVIRTAGQSHFDGLIEGSPEGVGGVPITRKQIRASRKALDLIEDEVGRPINLHSYVSGVAGPEIAVMFAEEGVNGAHQDPQYNVLYRDINMLRSFVDAAEAKKVMTAGKLLQIDGAHNANATAREAWKVMPELLVQHAINTAYSELVGMSADSIALSVVPPTAPPAPALRLDLPHAVAVRWLFDRYRIRGQMNTRYIESSEREATVTHVLNLLVTRLTGADIQSTITPDEGKQVPWHYNSIAALDTARQVLAGLDGLVEMVQLRQDGPLVEGVRELAERAVLFLDEILAIGGYFAAVSAGLFVDSGYYPEREGDGIHRDPRGGVAAGTVVPRDSDYFAPVCYHFGQNSLPPGLDSPCDAIDGCTLCRPDKIVYIDELDPEDNVENRLRAKERYLTGEVVRPEAEWLADGYVSLKLFVPVGERAAAPVALAVAGRMGMANPVITHVEPMHPAEGTLVEIKGTVDFDIQLDEIEIPPVVETPDPEEIRRQAAGRITVVAGTAGHDEHSVGLREIIDLKHGGLESFGIRCHYLGTSVPVGKLLDAAVETGADAILMSTIITHADVHLRAMKQLDQLCREKGLRERLILVAGGTQVSDQIAREAGMDAGFGRGTRGIDVADFLVRALRGRSKFAH